MAPVFPDLKLRRFLGRGGMGCVYEGEQQPLGRRVAVKVLPMEGRTDRVEIEERFLREGRALARLDHPHVVKIYQFGEREGWLYLVMEYLDGEDLARRMTAQGRLPWREAAALAEQLCAGLAAAHALDVVHRDIKPGNLLLTAGGQLKIADFGLAKLTRDETSSWTLTKVNTSMGTPYYMAPEQRRGSTAVDARSDIYSAGVVLYEMLTGELPMGSYAPASSVCGAPAALDAVMAKAMAVQPEARWQTAEEMGAALRAALQPVPRRHWRWMAAGAALLAAVVGVAVWPRSAEPDPPQPVAARAPVFHLTTRDAIRLTAPEPGGLFATMAIAEQDILAVSRPGLDHFFARSACAGEVWLYPLTEDGTPGTPVKVQAQQPQTGDLFGFVIDLDPAGTLLAVTSPYATPADAGPGDDRKGSVDIFRRRGRENVWEREQTLWMDTTFAGHLQQIRAFIGTDQLVVGSPGDGSGGSVRVYARRGDRWELEAQLSSAQVQGEAYFGWFADPDVPGEVLVSAYRHADSAGALCHFVRREGKWQEQPPVVDPAGTARAMLGMSFQREGRQLFAGAMGDAAPGIAGAGSVLVFGQEETAGAEWKFVRRINDPVSPSPRAGFGHRVSLQGGLLAVSGMTAGTDSEASRSVVHFLPREATNELAGTIQAAEPGDVWRGRTFYSSRLFAVCHPREPGPGGEVNSGALYVFPRGKFPQLFPESRLR